MTQIREICTRDTDPGRGQAAPRSQRCWRLRGAGRGIQGLLHGGLPRGGGPLPHLWGKGVRYSAHRRKTPCSELRFRGIPRPLLGNASEAVAEARWI